MNCHILHNRCLQSSVSTLPSVWGSSLSSALKGDKAACFTGDISGFGVTISEHLFEGGS